MSAFVSAVARSAVSFRDCGAHAPRDRGRIPSASEFSGLPLDSALPGGRLYECRSCRLCFRAPLFEPAFYDALYARTRSDEWDGRPQRIDHERIAAALQRHRTDGDVLDVGYGSAEPGPARRLKLVALLHFYLLAPTRYSRALAARRGWSGPAVFHTTPPGPGLSRDHFVAVVRKTA